jgi:pimeloyl-ACP methyl ester carboxylesterase
MVADYSGWGWTDRDPGTWAEPNSSSRLDEISVPTLVVVGERDLPDMVRAANALASGIAGAREIILPGLGHLPNMEDPAAFNRVVLDFLDSLDLEIRR